MVLSLWHLPATTEERFLRQRLRGARNSWSGLSTCFPPQFRLAGSFHIRFLRTHHIRSKP